MPGTLFVVATPIGNLEDITLRALRVLREVAVIAAEDTRRTGTLLRHLRHRDPHPQLARPQRARSARPTCSTGCAAGESVALVSDAGTPLSRIPGFRLVREAIAAGIPVEAIPGPSAFDGGAGVAGLPVGRVHVPRLPAGEDRPSDSWLEALAAVPRTLVFFEAPHRVRATLRGSAAARWAIVTVVLARELTKVHESVLRGWLATSSGEQSRSAGSS